MIARAFFEWLRAELEMRRLRRALRAKAAIERRLALRRRRQEQLEAIDRKVQRLCNRVLSWFLR